MRYRFGDFELDTAAFELTRAGEPVRVEPQVFGVLACLVERNDRLVTREELLDEVWGTRFVTDATVASRVKAARRAIGDDGKAQRLIRTVTRRGYRFVGTVRTDGRAPSENPARSAGDALVGRDSELGILHGQLRAAGARAARVVFVTGDAGSGKSSLVEAFLAGLGPGPARWVGRCTPTSHAEAYWPFLDALWAAVRSEPSVVDALSRVAPTWLVQLPLSRTDSEADALAKRVLGTTQGRMVRELVAALEAISQAQSLVLVLEDLHWADQSSLDLVDALVRLGVGAPLLIVGTARTDDALEGDRRAGALVDRLVTRDLAVELALAPLSEPDVGAYVRGHVRVDRVPAWLAQLLAERTGGNALFVRCLLDAWLLDRRLVVGDGVLVVPDREELARDVPSSVRRLVRTQLDVLDSEAQALLGAASVVGARFSAADVAAATGAAVAETDDALGKVAADRRLIRAAGRTAWPDGTRSGGYAFTHELHRDVLYDGLAPSRRAALHGSLARGLERAHGSAAEAQFAARLAQHFLEAGDDERALRYLTAAAAHALRRSAHAEAARHASTALELLGSLPDQGDRGAAEIELRSTLAATQIALRGWAAPEIEASYERARELCETSREPSRLPSILYGLATLHEYRGAYERSESLMSSYLETGSEALAPEALELLACSTFHQGRFGDALAYAERGLSAYDASLTSEHLARYGESPAVGYHCWAALSLWFLGRGEESSDHMRAALEQADEHSYSRTTALVQGAFLHQFRGETDETRRWAESAIDVAAEHGFPFRAAQATVVRGWALAADGDLDPGAAELARGLELYRETGAGMDVPYYLGLQADVESRRGRSSDALAVLDEAGPLVPARGFFYEPQLLVLEARLRSPDDRSRALGLLTRAMVLAETRAMPRVLAAAAVLADRLRAGEPIDQDGAAVRRQGLDVSATDG